MINNEAAYEAGKRRNIVANARKTFDAKHSDVVDFLYITTERSNASPFVWSLFNSLCDYGKLSEKQIQCCYDLMDDRTRWSSKRAAEVAAKEAADSLMVPLVEKRQTITGEVVSVKSRPGYAYNSIEYKMTVKAETGHFVWLTVPVSLQEIPAPTKNDPHMLRMVSVGEHVMFDCKIKNGDNNTFNFGSRPTKAQLC